MRIVTYFRWDLATSNFPSVWRVLFSPIPRQPHNSSYFLKHFYTSKNWYSLTIVGFLFKCVKGFNFKAKKIFRKSSAFVYKKYFYNPLPFSLPQPCSVNYPVFISRGTVHRQNYALRLDLIRIRCKKYLTYIFLKMTSHSQTYAN